MVFHGFWLVSIVFQGSFMVFHGFWLVSMVFQGGFMVIHGFWLVSMVFHITGYIFIFEEQNRINESTIGIRNDYYTIIMIYHVIKHNTLF